MERLRDTPFKHFDLPVNHLGRHGHYIPPKARNEAEIERRKALRSGTLLAEQQQKGTAVAAKLIDFMKDKDDSDFAPNLIAAAAFNTAWHNHAQGALDVMRRRLWLPVHSRSEADVTRESLMEAGAHGLTEAVVLAGLLARCHESRSAATPTFRKKYGRATGNSALVLAGVSRVEQIAETNDPEIQQYQTRKAAMAMATASRDLEERVGANPTFAQLADRDSPLAVYVRRQGTNTSLEALEYATAEVLEAA